MRKKIFTLLTLLIFISSGAQAEAQAEWTSGDCKVTVDGGTLIVSGTGAMADCDNSSDQPWADYQYDNDITAIVIENGVTSIGAHAFENFCLETLTIPSSVTSIGAFAFSYCDNLSNLTLTDLTATIGEYAFTACRSLETLTISSSVMSIGASAFEDCTSLKTLTLNNGLETIGNRAFWACEKLTMVTIPSTVTSIGADAFAYCTDLTTVYCYPNADDLSLDRSTFTFDDNILCYVRSDQYESYLSKFGEESDNYVNVLFQALDVNSYTLSETTNNSGWIEAQDGKIYNITLTRTLKTGGWNTFCVPFDLSSSQINSVFGEDTKVKELYDSSFDGDDKVLDLVFDDAVSIKAGKPYLVWVGSNSNIVNPVFNSVIISNTTGETVTTDCANFVPVINPASLTAYDKTVLFVTASNKLTWPTATGDINGFRAYFQLVGDAVNARSFTMSFDDETVAIKDIEFSTSNDKEDMLPSVYDLQGRQVNGQTTKGMYIVNGNIVIIK